MLVGTMYSGSIPREVLGMNPASTLKAPLCADGAINAELSHPKIFNFRM
jgi:hypothetical protein